ncbi:MAG: hypothetical protein PHG63_03905, partial [Candidatus Dojkabacteria bacterium]|nr:hypothetical protein [Candidatus Dojkabacteria bacterium]
WIPRIFVLMTFMYIVLQIVKKVLNNRLWIDEIVLGASLVLSIVFFFSRPDFSDKYIQVLTWFAFFMIGLILYRYRDSKLFRTVITTGSGLLTAVLFFVLMNSGRSTSVFQHKYPPTLYYIAYNTFAATAVYSAAILLFKKIRFDSVLLKAIRFLARHSYQMFFMQIITLDVFETLTGFWLADFIIVTIATIAFVALVDYAGTIISKSFRR